MLQSRRRRETIAARQRVAAGFRASDLTQDMLRAGRETEEARRIQARQTPAQDDGFWTPELKQVRKQLRREKKRDLRGTERKRLAKLLSAMIAMRMRQVAAKRVLWWAQGMMGVMIGSLFLKEVFGINSQLYFFILLGDNIGHIAILSRGVSSNFMY